MLPVLRLVYHAQNTSIVSRRWRVMWRKSKPVCAQVYMSGRGRKAARSFLFSRMIPIETLSFDWQSMSRSSVRVISSVE
jgi:hypothetical protein